MPKRLCAFLFSSLCIGAWAVGSEPTLDKTHRLVVQFKAQTQTQQAPVGMPRVTPLLRAKEQVARLAERSGIPMVASHVLGDGSVVVRLDAPRSVAQARELAQRVAAQSEVAWAGVDVRVRAQAFMPNDPHFLQQWALQPRSRGVLGSAAFSDAWDVPGAAFTGSPSVIVALIDTGRVPHVDLAANEIDGYDFVSPGTLHGVEVSGDGDGRDPDPSDPGDFCPGSPLPSEQQSSWHGLKMASLIAALTDNAQGIAGAAPGVRVQHVRALGRCGGWLSDVAEALRWAVGGEVAGIPVNPSAGQVRVANLSLGSLPGLDCESSAYRYMLDAVRAAEAAGVVVVAAAGNEEVTSVGLPAGCPGVIAVGAHTSLGDLADYSNRSPRVSLTAPGAGCSAVNALVCDTELIVSLGNNGETTPGDNLWRDVTSGTSAATPFVSAAAALMISLDDTLTPHQVRTILAETTRPHPPGTYCALNPGLCGTGMLDAEAAVLRVRDGPIPDNPRRSGGGGALAWGWLVLLGLAVRRARRLQI
jgi:serine protease